MYFLKANLAAYIGRNYLAWFKNMKTKNIPCPPLSLNIQAAENT